jgi:hypothetical protein
MALKVSKVDVWRGDIQDTPGGLSQVLEGLAAGGASVEFVIARRNDNQPGMGQVFLTPVKGKKAQDAARQVGLNQATPMATLRVEGADRPGVGGRMLRAMADGGINLRGVSAAVIGNKFVAYVGFDSDADAANAMRILKGFDERAMAGARMGRAGGTRANGRAAARRRVTTARRRRSA